MRKLRGDMLSSSTRCRRIRPPFSSKNLSSIGHIINKYKAKIRNSSAAFVDVPVKLIETNALVYNMGDNSGVDLRLHLDWLHCSSDAESDSSSDHGGGSDPGHDFKIVRDRPVCAVSRGRPRGRGRRGR
ncbi:hypothetical protein MA16_Dca013613 [Dendrobium catenatum]|uniref:Uncharacterized protein n=1 Tax=Dendrobium catenatum TaxID=906689 RepID=A0A2I0VUV5_9ASPA|nr:hypothetical protein MA16_Dca013613 [Dendrobium catenatum]